jgi:TetR/AcrR family transcriptional repressor of nem operon
MIDMIADLIPDVPRKAARRQASATLATMMGTLVLSRIAGTGEASDEILAAGREAALGRSGAKKQAAKRPARTTSARH